MRAPSVSYLENTKVHFGSIAKKLVKPAAAQVIPSHQHTFDLQKKSTKKMEPKLPEKMVCAGAAACTADIVSFPLDVAKVRLQIGASSSAGHLYHGLFGTLLGMARHEGVASLYGGISPGLQRQCLFASIRIGLYDPVKDFYTELLHLEKSGNKGGGGTSTGSAASTMMIRIASAITTGAIGISVAQPTDVVKVRMQAQSRGGSAAPGGVFYSSSLQAYRTIYRSEGLAGLWKGLGPNIARNSVVNAAELVCYDTVKEALIERRVLADGFLCHLTSAFSAGFCATFVSSPIDVVKTNYMNSSEGQYAGVFHCARTIARGGGLAAFYKGFMPSFMRLGTWNVVMFVSFEQLKRLSSSMKQKDSGSGGVLELPAVVTTVVTTLPKAAVL